MQGFLYFPVIFDIFDDFSKFCCTFGRLHSEKSLNIAKILQKMKKVFQLLYYLNGCFWNQKCSQCIGLYDIITKHQNSISNYWLPVIENTCYKIQNLSHIFTFTYYHFQKKKNINIWFSSFYRCSLPILTNPNPF